MAAVLCAGHPSNLMELRCEVLSHSGYHAQAATVSEAIELLSTRHFDLVLISAKLSEAERLSIHLAAGIRTRTLELNGFVFPADLLRKVAQTLEPEEEAVVDHG